MKAVFLLVLYPLSIMGSFMSHEIDSEYSFPFDFTDNDIATTCYALTDEYKPYCDPNIPSYFDKKDNTIKSFNKGGPRGGCFTLTDIWKELDQNILFAIDPSTEIISKVPTGTWMLTEDLFIQDGITLNVIGTVRGGDCDELRLFSDDSKIINLRGHGGSLNFKNTKVLSWNPFVHGPDTNVTDGRSHVSCVSENTTETILCEGMKPTTVGECRMDISCSEFSNLGYNEPESSGITYKVKGLCPDSSNLKTFNKVGVYGNILDSNLHDNYNGHYSYGHKNGEFVRNVVHDNIENGILLDKIDKAIVINNEIRDNFETGITFVESSRGDISGNMVKDNTIGLKVSNSKKNVFEENEFGGSTSYDVVSEGNYMDVLYDNLFYVTPGYKGLRVKDTDNLKLSKNKFKNGVGYVESISSKGMLFVKNDKLILDADKESCVDPASDLKSGANMCG